jgi:hypothetical protein
MHFPEDAPPIDEGKADIEQDDFGVRRPKQGDRCRAIAHFGDGKTSTGERASDCRAQRSIVLHEENLPRPIAGPYHEGDAI